MNISSAPMKCAISTYLGSYLAVSKEKSKVIFFDFFGLLLSVIESSLTIFAIESPIRKRFRKLESAKDFDSCSVSKNKQAKGIIFNPFYIRT